MIVDDAVSRRAARRRHLHRALALFCFAGACAATAFAFRPAAPDAARVDADTRFDFVAVFAPEASGADVERWRAAVLRAHRAPCLERLPCTARVLRFAGLGPGRRYAIGFDLSADISAEERAALLAAAQAQPVHVRLVVATTPRRAAGE